MSSRNHACHRKVPTCCTKKPRCPTDHCSARNNNNCHNHCVAEDPCAGHAAAARGCGTNHNNGGEQPLRNHLSEALVRQPDGGGNPKDLEAEVERLVECARAWSEKEKFKLKQYYEEEMVRKKKQVIQEFTCAMEREVIAPLKTKLCDYEKEIHKLKAQLQDGGKCPPQIQTEITDTSSSGLKGAQDHRKSVMIALDVVDKVVDKARKSNRQLQVVINKEKRRKSVRSASLATDSGTKNLKTEDEEADQDQQNVEGEIAPGNAPGEEDMAELEVEEEMDPVVEETVDNIVETMLKAPDVSDETKIVVKKVKDLSEALVSTKNFTEEQIADLIREGELAQAYKKLASELQTENEELKRRIAELLKQLELLTPRKGSVEEENMMLRQQIQELEGERTRGSLQTELNLLKQQLEDLWAKNEEEKARSESQLGLIPEEEGEAPDGDAVAVGSIPLSGGASKGGSTPEGPKTPQPTPQQTPQPTPQQTPVGSRKNSEKSPPLSKGPSAKTLSGKSSGGDSGGHKSQKGADTPGQKSPGGADSGGKISAGGVSEKGAGSNRSRKRSLTLSMRSKALSARSVGEITGPFEDQIKLLLERITELEDSLNAMAELELRLKELEEQTQEMELLKQKLKELTDEVEELRAKECAVCPVPSETELKATRKKLEEAEAFLEKKAREFEELSNRLKDMEQVNEELSKSVASFKTVAQKHEELESLHAQVLEEKRRKSLEARELGEQVTKLEGDYLAALKELDKLKSDLQNAEERAKNGDEIRRQLEAQMAELRRKMEGEMEEMRRRLEAEVSDLRRQLDENNNNVEQLKRQLRDKEALLEEMRTRNAVLQEDADIARRKLEEALREKEKLDLELDTVRRHCEQVQNDLMRQLREQQKKCSEACDALSKRGQCILEHEKKCMNVTSQMEKDNDDLRGKLRQMQEQLDAMVNMEQITRALHGQMEDFHRRAMERSRELEELKKLPETCDLKNMQSTTSSNVLPSPLYSLPDLPTPSQLDYNASVISNTNGGEGGGGGGRRGSTSAECKLITAQLRDLEREKDQLGSELDGKLKAVEDINQQLEMLQSKDKKLREEKDKACKER